MAAPRPTSLRLVPTAAAIYDGTKTFQWPLRGPHLCDEAKLVKMTQQFEFQWPLRGPHRCGEGDKKDDKDPAKEFQWPLRGPHRCDEIDCDGKDVMVTKFQWPLRGPHRATSVTDNTATRPITVTFNGRSAAHTSATLRSVGTSWFTARRFNGRSAAHIVATTTIPAVMQNEVTF